MSNSRLRQEAHDHARIYFENGQKPSHGELCNSLRKDVGDTIYVPRFAAMVISRINELRELFECVEQNRF